MKIAKDLTQLIGNTPLLKVCHIEREEKLKARLLVKLESFNHGGSMKDGTSAKTRSQWTLLSSPLHLI